MQNLDYYLEYIENNLSNTTKQKLKHEIEAQYHVLNDSLSNICISKITNIYSLIVSTYNTLVKEIGEDIINELIVVSYKNRPIELIKRYNTVKVIFVFSLVSIAIKDYVLLKKILDVYASLRFYMYFTSKIEYCNQNLMNIAIEKLTLKTLVKQYHGSYPKVVSRIVDSFYNKYLQPYLHKKNEDVVHQLMIVLDYTRTRVKQILQTLIKSYYDVYENREKYEKFQEKREFLSYHINQITQRFIMYSKSEIQHLTFNKNILPDSVALELVKGYLSNIERTSKIIQVLLSMFDKTIHVSPCNKEYANEIRKLYVKKKSQSYFEEIDLFNMEILSKVKIPDDIIIKYARHAGKMVVYRLELRSYFILLLYKSIYDVIC